MDKQYIVKFRRFTNAFRDSNKWSDEGIGGQGVAEGNICKSFDHAVAFIRNLIGEWPDGIDPSTGDLHETEWAVFDENEEIIIVFD